MKKILILLLTIYCCVTSGLAQDLRSTVEKGVAQSNTLISNHNWTDAFGVLRSLDFILGTEHPELHYLVSKQRFTLYKRLNKHSEVTTQLDLMAQYAQQSKDQSTLEDMLVTKADYYGSTGNQPAMEECYKQLFQQRSQRIDATEIEKCYQDLISEAKQKGNKSMGSVINMLYTQWQDSVASVKAAQELSDLKALYAQLQEEDDSKATKITAQWVSLAILTIVAIALAAALAFFILLLMRNKRINSKLRNELQVAKENNDQKSLFISNISQQMSPSLNKIALGESNHIEALRMMLQHIERYMDMENLTDEQLEVSDTNVYQFCNGVVDNAYDGRIPINVDAQKLSFPIAKEVLHQLLTILLQESCLYKGTERITLGFKKHNPHVGQFFVNVIGMKLTDEEKETLLIAFARVYDLSETDGLAYPTCALMANKMGGKLTLDSSFSKGTRFLVDIRC